MSTHVEARSLGSLNFLAANPPQYPVNPAEELQEDLILYISRVPGTRDVILSTFKPHVKNVTAEDVANALYYVHLELPIDAALAPPAFTHHEDTPRSSQDSSSSTNQIRRKPLPLSGTAKALDHGNPGISKPDIPGSDRSVDDWDKAQRLESDIRHMLDIPPELPPRPLTQSPPVRKPLGPRPMTPSKLSSHERDLGEASGLELSNHQHFSAGRGSGHVHPSTTGQPLAMRGASRSSSPTKRNNSRDIPFSIALIRRDPSSGTQWNVGRVSSYQQDISGIADDYGYFQHERHETMQTPQYPINIHLDTSGYAKFRGIPSRLGLEGTYNEQSSSLPRATAKQRDQVTDGAENAQSDFGFNRQVVMTYRQSWTSAMKSKFRHSESTESASPPRLGHSRQESTLSNASADSSTSGGETTPAMIVTQPGQGLKPQGYIFMSPWDGRCEFRTGNAGRSVKCRHVLDSPSSAENPLVPASQGRHGSLMSGSAPVSELRFNLPSAELFKPSTGVGGKAHQIHGHFSKLLRLDRQDLSTDEDDPASPFELPLGKERAGGGNRGKRAKLGKLIVHHDGLKMLDLVVAANMGLWWGAWERSF